MPPLCLGHWGSAVVDADVLAAAIFEYGCCVDRPVGFEIEVEEHRAFVAPHSKKLTDIVLSGRSPSSSHCSNSSWLSKHSGGIGGSSFSLRFSMSSAEGSSMPLSESLFPPHAALPAIGNIASNILIFEVIATSITEGDGDVALMVQTDQQRWQRFRTVHLGP